MEKDKGKEPASDEENDEESCDEMRNYEKILQLSPRELKFLCEHCGIDDKLVLNFDIRKAMRASTREDLYSRNIPNGCVVIKDKDINYYLNIDSVEDYYNKNISSIFAGNSLDHNEVIRQDHGQKIYMVLPSSISDKKQKELLKKFQTFISEKFQKNLTCSIIRNTKKYEFDIVVDDVFVKNSDSVRFIVQQFVSTLSKDDANMIPMSLLNEYNSDTEKPTMFSKFHRSVKKDEFIELSNSTDRNLTAKMIELLKNSFYTVQKFDGAIVQNTTINNIININPTNCVIAGNINNDISGKISKKPKIIEFINYIKNEKPEWYTPNEFIPKALLTEKFNDYFDEDFSTQKLMINLKKSGVKDMIFDKEKLGTYFNDIFGDEGKRYRGFIAKNLW